MATTVFDLVAKLSLDSSEFDSGMDDAESKSSSFGDKLKSGLGSAAKVGAGAVAALGTAAIAAGTALVKGTGDVAAYGDNIDKMSQKMGLSAQAYQEWDAIMQHSGTSMETMKAGMKTLANAVESGNDAFQRIGLTQEQIASMSQEDLFAATIAGLQNVENETERTYLAGQLLGRGATELGALLNTSAEDTEAMRQRVHELGGVMSDDAVKASARYQDSLQDMKTAFSGLSRNMMSEFLPSIATVMDGLSELFSGGDGLGKISEGINQFVGNLSAALPRVMETGSKIVLALGDAIVANLPVLFEAATQFILTLGQGIVQQLPMLIKAALSIVLQLAKGISESLPELIPTIVDVVLEIVDILIDNVDLLIEASLQIIIALAEGIINSLPILIEKAPEIIIAIVDTLVENFPKIVKAAFDLIVTLAEALIENLPEIANAILKINEEINAKFGEVVQKALSWGADLVSNFASGIKSAFGKVKDAVSGLAGLVSKHIHFSEPDVGPLSDFHTYAPDMMKSFAKGIEDNLPLVEGSMNRMGNMIRGNMQFSTEGVNRGATYNGGITINVYQREGENDTEFARRIADIINSDVQRKRAVYA